jgi:CO dehydrogenase maturation factor
MREEQEGEAKVIAVCGKGGVGKTSVSSMIVKLLLGRGAGKVLAIDADPAVGLSTALGVEIGKTLDDIRRELISLLHGDSRWDRREILAHLDYEMLSALREQENLAFLAIGRPEDEGCYCQINGLLRQIIASLSRSFDYVVIDGEAGIEQVNRRVMEKVTHLVLVSDPSVKGLEVVQSIKSVSDSLMRCESSGLLINKVRGPAEFEGLSLPEEVPCIGWIPESDLIRECDMDGRSILELVEASPIDDSVTQCMENLGILVRVDS